MSLSAQPVAHPRPARLAAELVRGGAALVVVGSTARALLDPRVEPADLDVAVADDDLDALVGALAQVGVPASGVALRRARVVSLSTAWGPLDVFVGAVPPCTAVEVDGVVLAVGVPR